MRTRVLDKDQFIDDFAEMLRKMSCIDIAKLASQVLVQEVRSDFGAFVVSDIEKEMTEAEESAAIKASYEDGVCPDCQDDIPDDVSDGVGCENCGHVYNMPFAMLTPKKF